MLILGSSRLRKEYEQDAQFISSLSAPEENNGENGDFGDIGDMGDNGSNLNIIIDKSILFNNYVKEEEEKTRSLSSNVPSAEKVDTTGDKFLFDTNIYLPLENNNMLLFNKTHHFDYFPLDYHQPMISPINYRAPLFPLSTKNHFNFDMMINPYDISKTFLRSPVCIEKYINKEINMQNKILINEL
jgi:hypothetical protein